MPSYESAFSRIRSRIRKPVRAVLAGTTLAVTGLSTIAVSSASASQQVYFASVNGSGSLCTAGIPCTLSEALASAPSGGTVDLVTAGVQGDSSTYYQGGFNVGSTTVTIEADASLSSPPILDGGGTQTVLTVQSGGNLTVSGLIIQNGHSNASLYGGGGIYSGAVNQYFASLTVTNTTFLDNYSRSGGGAIRSNGALSISGSTFTSNSTLGGGAALNSSYNGGTMSVSSSTFSNNTAGNSAAISSYMGTLNVTGSTFADNSATTGPVGGIALDYTVLNLSESTLYGNTSVGSGAAVATSSSAKITNTTFDANSTTGASTSGSDVWNSYSGTVYLAGDVLAGNCRNDGGGSIVDDGYNLTSGTTCGTVGTDVSDSSLASDLGPLANHGGSTATVAFNLSNPALQAIPTSTTAAGVQICTVTDQAGSTSYQSLGCNPGSLQGVNQAITYSPAPPATASPGSTWTPSATSSSSNAVTFAVDPSSSAVCSISSGTVTFNASGSCVVDATAAGDTTQWVPTLAQTTVTVTRATQTVSFTTTPSSPTYHGTYTPAASATSGLTPVITVDATTTSNCSISSGTVTFNAAGTGSCVLDANQAGNSSYLAAAQVQQTISVAKATQTVHFTSTAPSAAVVGGAVYHSAASSTSGDAVSITVDPSSGSVCSVDGAGTVRFESVGTCVLDANQAGDSNYLPASQVQQSFSVGRGSQAVGFTTTAPSSATVAGTTYTPSAFSTSGDTVLITVDAAATSVCAIDGNGTVSFQAIGTCVLDANQAGDTDYRPANQVQQAFSVGKGAQTIHFTSTAPGSAVIDGASYTPAATATSGDTVAVTVDSSASSICSISGGVVTFQGAGSCVLDANQSGDTNYLAAPQVQQSFNVAKKSQTVHFSSTSPSDAIVAGDTYTPAATATSGDTATITVDASASSVCSIDGGVVSFQAVGSCVLDANQAGDTHYLAAPQVQQSFNVGKGYQTVSFGTDAPEAAAVAGDVYEPTATSTSGDAVAITVDATSSSVCSIDVNGDVSFQTVGTCVLDANQSGDANYYAAPQVQQSFDVGQGIQTLRFTTDAPTAVVAGDTYTPAAVSDSADDLIPTITVDSSSAEVCSIDGQGVVSFQASGTCTLDANQDGDVNYLAADQVQQSFDVGPGSQTVHFTTNAPSGALVAGATYSPAATATSGLYVDLTVDSSATSVCSIADGVVSFQAVGNCVMDADQPGDVNYEPAPQVQQTFAVARGYQTVQFTSVAPSIAVAHGSTYSATASATSGLTVTITVDASSGAVCSIDGGGLVRFEAAGTCVLDANQPGNSSYFPADQVQQTFSVGAGPQTVGFTSTAPSNAAVAGSTYTPTALASSGLTPAITVDSSASGVCSISSGTVSFQSVGTCVLDADQIGNSSYNPAPRVQQSFTVGKGTQSVHFTSTRPSSAVVAGSTYTPAAVSSISQPVTITVDASASSVCSISSGVVSFQGAGTCVLDANQAGTANYNPAPQVQQSFTVGKGSQSVSFTSTAPVAAVVAGATYTPTASATSGLTPAITVDASASSVCSISSGVVSFRAAGNCLLDAAQAGSANYNPGAQVQQSFSVGRGTQSVSFTSTAPSAAVVAGATYSPSLTASSGLTGVVTVDGSASSVCSISLGVVSFQAAGTCVLDANQAGNSNYYPAGQVQQSFAVGKGSQSVHFTSTAPSAAVVAGSTYTPAASTTSGLSPAITVDASASSVCSISSGVVSFQGAGTCVLDADQAGSANYNPAAQVQQSFGVGKGSQSVSFASTAPSDAVVAGDTYIPSTDATSGLTPTITVDASASSVCSISSGVVSFQSVGSCVLDADQPGDSNYNAAAQVQQSFGVGKGSQSVSFGSAAPSAAVVAGSTYTPTAGATSDLAPTITVDASASSVCSISSGVVSFQSVGSCVLDANQAGNSNYDPAAQVQQSFAVGKGSQTVSFTSTAPSAAVINGATYTPTATSSSGGSVSITIDASSTSVCAISSGVVSFVGAGSCVLDANQPGDANYLAAAQATQGFTVVKMSQTLSFTSQAPVAAVSGGPTYTPQATASSGLAPVITVDASSATVCSVASGAVSFNGPGVCRLDATQSGNADYLAVSTQQSFNVANSGYFTAGADGGVFNYAGAALYGSASKLKLTKPVVGMAATADGKGYWLVASDGGIFNYGDAAMHGSAANLKLTKPIVGMASTPDGGGYWLVASDGGIFNYGDAKFYGSAGALTLTKPIIGMAVTPDGKGYWLVASDGGIFNYGDAVYYGAAAMSSPATPIVGMTATLDGRGYWMVTAGGHVYHYGDAVLAVSVTPTKPVVGIVAAPDGTGYRILASNGTVYNVDLSRTTVVPFPAGTPTKPIVGGSAFR